MTPDRPNPGAGRSAVEPHGPDRDRPRSDQGPRAATGPWHQAPDQVAAELDSDLAAGLSDSQAAARQERYGPNRLAETRPVPAWRKLLAQFADPLVYLLLVAVAVSLVVWWVDGADGVPYEAVVILVIVVANAVLGYVQEQRAEAAVAALQRMAAATATVRRDGRLRELPAFEVVPGDVLVLAEGDAVTADARLVEVAGLTVAEAALTGESEAVVKQVEALHGPVDLGDRTNMVFSGTAVTRGRGVGVVTATGMETEMGGVARLLEATEDRKTPLQTEVDRIGRMLGLAVIGIAVVVMAAIAAVNGVDGAGDVVEIGLVGVSLAVAAVPEGLPAILSVVLAVGVQRLARQQAIVKRLASVETLGSATVVCSDKTGTLTRNEMTIVRLVTASGEVTVTGSGYEPTGEFLVDDQPLGAGALRDEVGALLEAGSLANNATLHHSPDGWTHQGDPTEVAFLVAATKAGPGTGGAAHYVRVGEVPFSSERKLMSTLNAHAEAPPGSGGDLLLAAKGAPDVLLGRCRWEHAAGDVMELSDRRRAELLGHVERLAGEALRTLGVASRRYGDQPGGPLADPDRPGDPDELEPLEHDLVFLGFVGIIDPARPEAGAAVAQARAAGVRTVMITGDHPGTARRIAEDLGIITAGDDRVLTGSAIDNLDDAALLEASRRTPVYARVTPEHKLRIVAALQADGNVAAMTGDGVNDGPALKAADIGVAMGITGTEVAKEAADMILADDNFATIVGAVRQGRAILSNIRKFLRFLLSSNTGEVLTMLLGVLGAGLLGLDQAEDGIAVPLLATQILWVNLLSDTGPALAMGVDPPPDDLMDRPARRADERIIDRTMWTGIVWVGLVTAVVSLAAFDLGHNGGLIDNGGTLTEGRTMAFTTLVLAQLFNALNSRSERTSAFRHLFSNRLLWAALALSALLQVAVVHLGFLNTAFETTPLDAGQWLACVALASAVLWASEARKLAARRLTR